MSLRKSFAFETTLAGKTYLHLIRQLVADGWQVNLYYLWLEDVEVCINRVKTRVASGGHDVPRTTISRRYQRSVTNFINHYAPLCSSVVCMANYEQASEEIFRRNGKNTIISNHDLYQLMQDSKSERR